MNSIVRLMTVLFLFIHFVYAQSAIIIEKDDAFFDSFRLERYEDKTASLGLEQVQLQRFESSANNIAEGYSDSAFWYRFDISNHTGREIEYILDITEKHISHVDLYIVSEGKTISLKSGNDIPYDQRSLQAPTIRFPISLHPNETKTLYIRMTCVTTLYTSIHLADKASFAKIDLLRDQMYSIYFGATMIFIFYTFFLYLSMGEKIYLYYISYVASFAMWQFAISGFPSVNKISGDLLYQLAAFSLSSLFIFIILFSRELLMTKRLMPKIDNAARLSIVLAVLLIVSNLFDSNRIIFMMNLAGLVFIPALFLVAVKSYRLGNQTAYFYLLAQSVFLILVTPFSLMATGIFPYSYFNRYSAMAGSIYEIVFFSLALANRIKMLKNEKLQLEIKAKQALEREVYIRTADLIKTQNDLEELNKTLESKVEEEVEKNRKQQEAMMRNSRLAEMGEILNSVAHQWRQPLSRINSNIAVLNAMLVNRKIDEDTFNAKIENIKKNTKYMSDTIEDFSRYFHPNKKKNHCLLYDLMEQTLELIESRTQRVNITMSCKERVELFTYENEFQQVLLIILNNALDNFELQSVENPTININAVPDRENNMVSLTIQDNGGGVKAKEIGRIFEPYYTTKFANSGTGLGLYVAKMLIENSMHGRLNVENINGGACFTIVIPLTI